MCGLGDNLFKELEAPVETKTKSEEKQNINEKKSVHFASSHSSVGDDTNKNDDTTIKQSESPQNNKLSELNALLKQGHPFDFQDTDMQDFEIYMAKLKAV